MRALAICLTLLLAACSKGGGSSATATASPLIGSWQLSGSSHKLFEFKADGTFIETNRVGTTCVVTTSGSYADQGTSFMLVTGAPTYSDQTACDAQCNTYYSRNCSVGDWSYTYNKTSVSYEVLDSDSLKVAFSTASTYLDKQ